MEIIHYFQAQHLFFLVYGFLFLGMLVEGLLFALTVSVLISQGAVALLPAVFSVLAGAMLEQWLFYYTGRRLNNFSRVTAWANRVAGRFDGHIQKRALHTLLISKFIYGVHRAILIRTGMLKLPARQFLRASVISTLFWLLVIGGLSYTFSAYLLKFAKFWSWIDFLPFMLIFVFLLAERLIGKFLKRWL